MGHAGAARTSARSTAPHGPLPGAGHSQTEPGLAPSGSSTPETIEAEHADPRSALQWTLDNQAVQRQASADAFLARVIINQQRTVGNRAVQRLVGARASAGKPVLASAPTAATSVLINRSPADYEAAVKAKDWTKAANELNGLTDTEVAGYVKKLSGAQAVELHKAAIA